MRSLAAKLTLAFAVLTFFLAAFLFYGSYRLTDRQLKEIVTQQAHMALKFDLAIREYVREDIRPVMYDLLGEDDFIPETMSTSFVARSVFEKVRREFPDYIIKFSSDNPRNPVNQAGPEELKVIAYLNENPDVKRWSGQITIHGHLYYALFSARRMQTSCLKCHGDPADAPKSMLERYGDKAGFHRPIGEVIGTDTIAIPVSKMTESIWDESVKMFIIIGLAVGLFLLLITLTIRALATRPLSRISRHISEAAARPTYKDIEKISVRSRDEISEVARSFNVLFSKLQDFYGSLEAKVAERTADLEKINSELVQEIMVREETEQSLELTQFIIDHFADPIFFIRPDAKIRFANEAAGKQLGYSLDELMQMTVHQIAPDITQPLWGSHWHEVKDSGSLMLESDLRTKDGEIFPAGIKATYYHQYDTEFVFAVVRDVSDHRQAMIEKNRLEKRLQQALKMEAIGTLAGGVAHDLNNMLSGVVSYPEIILLDMPEDHRLYKPIKAIQQSGQRAAGIVQDLLTLSRRNAARFRPVNMNTIIKDYVGSPEFGEVKKEHPGCAISIAPDPDLLNIMGSEIHLTKIIMNLAINALESMPEGGELTFSTQNRYVDRTIKGYEDIDEGDYVLVRMSDTGIGISKEDQERIFEPFYTRKKMGRSGTGLGMAIVWGSVKDHDGFIGIDSETGKGTTFSLFFPATRKYVPETESRFVLEEFKGAGERILIVDDVLEQRQIASSILERLGYTAISVAGGEEAVAYLKNRPVELVLLDMIMEPGIDGLETYQEIIKIRPGQKAVIVSGFSESARVEAVQRLGAGQYVRKPYTIRKLAEAVKAELNRPEDGGCKL